MKEFPARTLHEILVLRPRLVADEPGGELKHGAPDRRAMLLHQKKLMVIRDRHDPDDPGDPDPVGKLPAITNDKAQEAPTGEFAFVYHGR